MADYSAQTIFNTVQRVINGEKVQKIAREIGVSTSTINNWRNKYSGFCLVDIENHINEVKKNRIEAPKKHRESKMYAGYKFQRLTALRFDKKDKRGANYWIFRCICGTEKSIKLTQILQHKTRSCGCLVKEIRELFKIPPSEYRRKLLKLI